MATITNPILWVGHSTPVTICHIVVHAHYTTVAYSHGVPWHLLLFGMSIWQEWVWGIHNCSWVGSPSPAPQLVLLPPKCDLVGIATSIWYVPVTTFWTWSPNLIIDRERHPQLFDVDCPGVQRVETPKLGADKILTTRTATFGYTLLSGRKFVITILKWNVLVGRFDPKMASEVITEHLISTIFL